MSIKLATLTARFKTQQETTQHTENDFVHRLIVIWFCIQR